MDKRFLAMSDWLRKDLGKSFSRLVPASADASFRRYFRLISEGKRYIIMDAPPDREDSRPFVEVAKSLRGFGLNVPHVYEQNLEKGFLLLSDLGEKDYLKVLNEGNADSLYADAIDALLKMQQSGNENDLLVPAYDQTLLMSEMMLFHDWLLVEHLQLQITDAEKSMLSNTFDLLTDNALAQPQVFVHRDYHSRNLMVCDNQTPGVLDFQDAVIGAISYDLVSLLRDCYVVWPREKVLKWQEHYCRGAHERGLLSTEQLKQFPRWFDLMGVQRHLKASGIFARLHHRDGKGGYLADIPRTLNYIAEVTKEYEELKSLSDFVCQRVLTKLAVRAGSQG